MHECDLPSPCGVVTGNAEAADESDNGFGNPPSQAPSASRYTFEPSDFADCLGGSAWAMTGCIFNGLMPGDPIAECGG